MKPYKNFAPQPIFERQNLPAGCYIAKVYDVALEEGNYGERLLIQFDIHEGEYADFFNKDWKNSDPELRKWRGTYRLYVPTDSTTEKREFTKRIFEQGIWAFEQSNNGFHWAWDEKQLKGLFVGVKFRNREYDFEGRHGWRTECCGLCEIQSIREGRAKTPKDKPLDKPASGSAQAANSGYVDVPEDELPF